MYAPPAAMAERGSRGFAALARLKPGVSRAAAQTDLDGVSRQLERAYPNTNEKRAVEVSPLDVELFGTLRPALLTLMAAVAFVLLIACANVANLLIARSEARRREIALRTALGAGRGRLLRQLVTESCVLTLIGAAVGLILARVSVAALIAQSPVTFPSYVAPGRPAGRSVHHRGVARVRAAGRPRPIPGGVDLNGALEDASRGGDGRRSQRLRNALVVVELSLAVVLLVGAGAINRSAICGAQPGLRSGVDPHGARGIPRTRPLRPRRSPPATPLLPGAGRERARCSASRAPCRCHGRRDGSDLPLDGGAGAVFYAAEASRPSRQSCARVKSIG
jgi:putative ABC transport system permease protein